MAATNGKLEVANGHADASILDMDQITSQLQKLGLSQPPTFPGVELMPQYNSVDIYRAYIIEQIQKITGAEPAIINNAVAWTQDLKHGDLVLPVPALRLKGKKPDELAVEIADKFDCPIIEKPTADKTFVRFFFKQSLASLTLNYILKQKTQFGFNPLLGLEDPSKPDGKRKRMIVEYSSPNIAKEFHTGHLRSTIIGGFLIKLHSAAGWETISMNYLGDWGKQYGMLSQGFEKYGSEAELERDPIKHLNEVYVKINQDYAAEQKEAKGLAERKDGLEKAKNPPKPMKPKKGKENETAATEVKWTEEQEEELKKATTELEKVQEALVAKPSIDEKARQFFKRMSEGDQEALKYWQKFRDLSIEAYKHMYARLSIAFDDYSGESTVELKDMDKAADVLQQQGISEDSKGAVIVDLAKHGAPKLGKTLVKKRDGTSLYLTRDIAANYERYEKYHFDRMIYVIASQQDVHVAQFFKILQLMGSPYSDAVAKCEHITFGMVKDPKGQTMSTRKGTVVSLADSLDAAKDFMHDVMRKNEDKYAQVEDPEATADTLAISAIMVQDYSGKMVNGYNFDMERMTSFEGDTGPYLQYSHARVCSMARKANVSRADLESADFSLITAKEGVELVRALAQWPDVFLNTYKTREPVTVLTYLFRMTHLLSSCYDAKDAGNKNAKTMSVMYADSAEKKAALMGLYEAARQVLGNGMRLLGLKPVERM
ncbi:arginyl-tRNA synthetase [Teratosphaeriaceae sp. CCFEE 6253]|nr:arginyl-tRNA synthetase [Teratosphaeriaceae sp. CCFEE 6253]